MKLEIYITLLSSKKRNRKSLMLHLVFATDIKEKGLFYFGSEKNYWMGELVLT